MRNIERANSLERRTGVRIPTMEEIRSAKAAGVPCSNTWISSERRKAKQAAPRSTLTAAQKAATRKAVAKNTEKIAAIGRMIASVPVTKKVATVPTVAALKAKLARLEADATR